MVKPILLVHGAWHGSWCWRPVAERLEKQGIPVHTVDLPLTSLADDAHAVEKKLNLIADAAVLIGHSYGGMVISEAAAGRDDVDHLVYLCAFCPEPGESLNDLAKSGERVRLADGFRVDDEGRVTVDPEIAPEALYGDCAVRDVIAAISRLRPLEMPCFATKATAAAWQSLPSTYVVCTEDQAIHVELQRRMATRAEEVVTWETSHSPFMSQPDRVAEFFAKIADDA